MHDYITSLTTSPQHDTEKELDMVHRIHVYGFCGVISLKPPILLLWQMIYISHCWTAHAEI